MGKKLEFKLDGETFNGEGIVDGTFVFDLVDTYGIPIELVTDKLRGMGMGFNLPSFIDKAVSGV